MAAIDTVKLQVAKGGSYGDKALLIVDYTMEPTLDDVQSDRAYDEHVQVFIEGRRIGLTGLEHPIPGAVYDGTVVFTSASQVQRNYEVLVPLSVLEQGIVTPAQPDVIQARVTLTPLPPQTVTKPSNAVDLNAAPHPNA
jgi:hypothetical protein